jgi:hypothetical protein
MEVTIVINDNVLDERRAAELIAGRLGDLGYRDFTVTVAMSPTCPVGYTTGLHATNRCQAVAGHGSLMTEPQFKG